METEIQIKLMDVLHRGFNIYSQRGLQKPLNVNVQLVCGFNIYLCMYALK